MTIPNGLTVLYTNADCLLNKLSELRAILCEKFYHFVCITESNLKSVISSEEVGIKDYVIFREDRTFNCPKGSPHLRPHLCVFPCSET